MLADGLVDALHLFVYPLSVGEGARLFEAGVQAKFELAASDAYENGAVYLVYKPRA